MSDEPQADPVKLAHDVFFTLKDQSTAARDTLLDSCRRYLTGHPGVEFFAVGTLVPDLDRPVNDLGFDVALHIVFADRKDHDVYQVSERHVQFIAENKESWERVRVFDSNLTP